MILGYMQNEFYREGGSRGRDGSTGREPGRDY